MKAFLVACAAAASVALTALPAASSPYAQANKYFGVRDRAQMADGFSANDIQNRPDLFTGKLLELRGPITAIVGSDAVTTVLIGGSEVSSAATTFSLPPKVKLDDWPFLRVGSNVRVLCQVVTEEATHLGSLEMRIAVKEYEALAVDSERAKKAAALAKAEAERKALAARQQQQRLASRGTSFRTAAARYPGAQLPEWQILQAYTSAIQYFNRRIGDAQARRIAQSIINYSRKYQLDARLVMAVIRCESNFNQNAVSRVGAMGLGQLMPGTADHLGVGNAWDVEQNLEGSTRLLSNHINNNLGPDGKPTLRAIQLALACYNAGAGAVKKYGGIPPYRETQAYVKMITRLYRQMCGFNES
jgi:soluble lytic murein transglycosylase-like protein